MNHETLHFDPDCDEWVLTTHLGQFLGETHDRCYSLYNEALRVAADHARHNQITERQALAVYA